MVKGVFHANYMRVQIINLVYYYNSILIFNNLFLDNIFPCKLYLQILNTISVYKSTESSLHHNDSTPTIVLYSRPLPNSTGSVLPQILYQNFLVFHILSQSVYFLCQSVYHNLLFFYPILSFIKLQLEK